MRGVVCAFLAAQKVLFQSKIADSILFFSESGVKYLKGGTAADSHPAIYSRKPIYDRLEEYEKSIRT